MVTGVFLFIFIDLIEDKSGLTITALRYGRELGILVIDFRILHLKRLKTHFSELNTSNFPI